MYYVKKIQNFIQKKLQNLLSRNKLFFSKTVYGTWEKILFLRINCFLIKMFENLTKKHFLVLRRQNFLTEKNNSRANLNIWSKIDILVKNRNIGQKLKFWVKIEILVTN